MKKNWYWIIKNDPWAYLKAKWNLFKNFSSFPLKKKMIYYLKMGENDYGFQFNKGVITSIFRYYFDIVNTLRFPFLPIFWIPLAGLIFSMD